MVPSRAIVAEPMLAAGPAAGAGVVHPVSTGAMTATPASRHFHFRIKARLR